MWKGAAVVKSSRIMLILVCIVALSMNLRPAAVSVGPVLDELRHSLGMSAAAAGILTSMPVIAFALFGALTPRVAERLGVHRLAALALLAVTVGLYLRTLVGSTWPFLTFSLLALAGMASANVMMPSLVKRHFPDRVGTMTAVYSTALAVGLTAASILTVPIGERFDGWRSGLLAWAILAAVCLLPWLWLVLTERRERPLDPDDPLELEVSNPIRFGQVARTRLGWLMACFFGLQSTQAYSIFGWFADIYRDAGFSTGTAGLLLGLITAVSIPLSFVVPALVARPGNLLPTLIVLLACYLVGYGGLIVAPASLPWLWAIMVGAGTATFPLVLTLIGLRAATPEGTAALSGFTQPVGYLIAAGGPFLIGVLREVTGDWTVSLLLMSAITVPLLLIGLAVSRATTIEDEVARRSAVDRN